MKKYMKGWHMLAADRKLGYSDGRSVEVGVPLSMPDWWTGMPSVCNFGMHASSTITDALAYNRGPILCRVVVSGDIDQCPPYRSKRFRAGYKFCGRTREVTWMKRLPKETLHAALCMFDPEDNLFTERDLSPDHMTFDRLNRRFNNCIGVIHRRALLRASNAEKSRSQQKKIESFLKGWALYNGAVE